MSSEAGRRLTRRQLTAALSAVPLLAGQNPAPSPGLPNELQKKAVDDLRQTSERLAQMEVPMDVPPAFVFRP